MLESQRCLTCFSGNNLLPPAHTTLYAFSLSRLFRGPPADHWALVSGLPTYVAENGFVSLSQLLQGNSLSENSNYKSMKNRGELTRGASTETFQHLMYSSNIRMW